MSRIRNTVLYKANAAYVKPFTRLQFEQELTKAFNHPGCSVDTSQKGLAYAFTWATAPQAGVYWAAMDTIIDDNKEKEREANQQK